MILRLTRVLTHCERTHHINLHPTQSDSVSLGREAMNAVSVDESQRRLRCRPSDPSAATDRRASVLMQETGPRGPVCMPPVCELQLTWALKSSSNGFRMPSSVKTAVSV